MNTLIIVITFLISIAIGIFVGMSLRKKIAESKIESAEKEAKRLLELARIETENMRKELKNILFNDILNTELIDVARISGQDPDSLASALALVPTRYRKGFAVIYFRLNGVIMFYSFISLTPSDANWNNTSYWKRYYNKSKSTKYNRRNIYK